MPREVVERLSGGVFDSDLVVDSNGDVKSGADYSDGFGNTIDQPDEPEATFVLPVLKPEGSAEEPDELTPLERRNLIGTIALMSLMTMRLQPTLRVSV